jgi:hypothetical protein
MFDELIRRQEEQIDMRILLVGGTWTVESETVFDDKRRSGLIDKIAIAIKNYCLEHYNSNYAVDLYNGGCYYDLETILNKTPEYDIVFWWPNVPDNDLPKIRNVKEAAPRVMLVTSKRNDGNKYSFMELTQRALAAKANMFFEFKKSDSKLFHINVMDPLGCHWYDGCDVTKAIVSAMDRLDFLRSMTRQKTVKSDIQKSEMMSLYFERTGENANRSHIDIPIPYEQEFINIVRKHAETFYTIFNPGKDVKRFLGNASLRPALNIDSTRCMRGMPSFKNENVVFVSQRNIDKQFIDIEHFVPCYMEEGKLYYCGDAKPSVDTPIQMRLYEALPNIRYMIHSHCYIDGAIFTNKSIPCGAIEEVDEVLSLIDNTYGLRNLDYYAINLKGHGSILMASNASMLHDVQYVGRHLPEMMFEGEN